MVCGRRGHRAAAEGDVLAASEQEVVDYVLHSPRLDEKKAIEEALDKAMDVWPMIAAHDMEKAMLRLHTVPKTL